MPDTSIIGKTLAGRFRITAVIGEGGMATVYRGVLPENGGEVAVKIMNPELAKESRFVRRFRREAKAAAMLSHPNTVKIIEFGVDPQGYVFLALELLRGVDLAILLHKERRVKALRAVQIVIQVCRALAEAHNASIVHRDLKPDNIMLIGRPANAAVPVPGMSDADYVKVLDFGIAKILDDAGEKPTRDLRAEPVTQEKSMLTRVGTIVGTPAYMAPEQGRAEPVDARTDLYACGVLLYELITGKVPFTGETPMQVVMRHVNEPPRPPRELIAIEPELEAVILKALSKFPAQRFQTAGEFATELERLLPLLGGVAPASEDDEDLRKRTLVLDLGPAETEPLPATEPAPDGRGDNPFPTLNIDIPDDVFPGPATVPITTRRTTSGGAGQEAKKPIAVVSADRLKAQNSALQSTMTSLADGSDEPKKRTEKAAAEDDEEAATMVKSPTEDSKALMTKAEEEMMKALAAPRASVTNEKVKLGTGLASFAEAEETEPTLVAPQAEPTGKPAAPVVVPAAGKISSPPSPEADGAAERRDSVPERSVGVNSSDPDSGLPTTELIPVTFEDGVLEEEVPRDSAPVWTGRSKRLSGFGTLMIGIVIGVVVAVGAIVFVWVSQS